RERQKCLLFFGEEFRVLYGCRWLLRDHKPEAKQKTNTCGSCNSATVQAAPPAGADYRSLREPAEDAIAMSRLRLRLLRAVEDRLQLERAGFGDFRAQTGEVGRDHAFGVDAAFLDLREARVAVDHAAGEGFEVDGFLPDRDDRDG